MWNYLSPDKFKEQNGYEISGIWYPRVTSILNIKAKPALYRYYAELDSFEQAEKVMNKSADEGTRVHEAVEAILLGESPIFDKDIKPSVDAFKNFLDIRDIQVDPDGVERRVINHNDRYAGTLDAMALIDGRFGIMDIKTSQGIYRDYNLQTAAYYPPLLEEFRNLQTRWILRIDQDQKCMICGASRRTKGGREKIRAPYPRNGINHKICNHEWGEVEGIVQLKEFPYWQDDYQAFLGAKKLWEWEHSPTLKRIGYL
ncbi:MAG: hypothetical protein COT89_02890 [Candidatus Colwellbacteria bacterium CG10_big_fil_rev_8_21_14_0_10_42_22]|uniref:PD-(D/E)XK endonuclease-like domain-containing protein n=1 Tax=Candidatus Colwellbacteria bacterium CG10_big_fil_rev_8_21_14_0_10_42_22 TaxID=1974540 RepID=A0A2H0VHR1_9BACT|nr:MAG: hypothetical protein COT89_02890 [Candidatus Colwellbacteria bacterium CG10_big_fil_rev_8_21_14_0_10_42_22]